MDKVGVSAETCILIFEVVWPEATCTVFAPDDCSTMVTVAEADLVSSCWLVTMTVTWLGEGTLTGAW
jgi:hypothetical protein